MVQENFTFADCLHSLRVIFFVLREQIQYNQEQIQVIRNKIEDKISELIKRYQVDITLEKIKDAIFNEKSFRDLYPMIDLFSEKIEVIFIQVVHFIWIRLDD